MIDVGAAEPKDIGLGRLKLSSERIAPGGLLQLNTELTSTGAKENANETTVELFVGDGNGQAGEAGAAGCCAQRRRAAAPVEFSLSGLKLGTHQGMVRIVGRDGLASDDVRYFTVDVRPPSKVLLLAEKASDALFVREALSPSSATGLVQSKFECQVGTFDKLKEMQLGDFAAVCLLDPPPLPNDQWQPLANFVGRWRRRGDFLGAACAAGRVERGRGAETVAGQVAVAVARGDVFAAGCGRASGTARVGELADTAPWSEFPVFKYWELEAGAEPAQVVATFANGKPALVERQIGAGSVIVMTTSVSDSAQRRSMEFAADGAGALAVFGAGEWSGATSGRRRADAAELSGRADDRVAAEC